MKESITNWHNPFLPGDFIKFEAAPGKLPIFSYLKSILLSVIVFSCLLVHPTEAQTTYVDTIPGDYHYTCIFYVQEDLLNVLDMTLEEFKQQIALEDLKAVDEALYYSTKTNSKQQRVNVLINDDVIVIPDEELPPGGNSLNEIGNAITNDTDGYLDWYRDEVNCYEAAVSIFYGNIGSNSDKWQAIWKRHIIMNGRLTKKGRQSTFIHEMGHTVGGKHENEGQPHERPWVVEVKTPRLIEYAAEEGYDPDLYIWLKTVMGTGPRVNIFSHIELHPSLEANVAELYETEVKESWTAYPILQAQIISTQDTLSVGSSTEIEAAINRDSLADYDFHWTVRQGGQIITTDTGSTLNYMPLDTGLLTIELFVQKSCGGQSAEKTIQLNVVEGTTSVENNYLEAIKFGPNPTTGMIGLYGETHTIETVRIYSQEGLPLIELKGDIQQIDLSHWSAGMYHLQLVGKDGAVYYKKVVKLQ